MNIDYIMSEYNCNLGEFSDNIIQCLQENKDQCPCCVFMEKCPCRGLKNDLEEFGCCKSGLFVKELTKHN